MKFLRSNFLVQMNEIYHHFSKSEVQNWKVISIIGREIHPRYKHHATSLHFWHSTKRRYGFIEPLLSPDDFWSRQAPGATQWGAKNSNYLSVFCILTDARLCVRFFLSLQWTYSSIYSPSLQFIEKSIQLLLTMC